MEIKKLDYDFSVCKVASYSYVNLESEYCFIGDTALFSIDTLLR